MYECPPPLQKMRRRPKIMVLTLVGAVSCLLSLLHFGGDSNIHSNPHSLLEKREALSLQALSLSLRLDGRPSNTDLGSRDQLSSNLFPGNRNLASTARSRQVKAIILTYMRSGSSLTGDIIQQHPDVFYVFEPLWSTERVFKGLRPATDYRLVDNTTISVPRSNQELVDRYNQVITSVLACRLEEVDVVTLTQYFMRVSLSTADFLNCSKDDRNLTRIQLCLKPLIIACQNSRAIVLKIIRSSFQNINFLFATDPQIHVVHLIRDPRGTLKSQLQVGLFKLRNTTTAATELCHRIKTDIVNSHNLSKQFPNRILTIRYEDIAEFPLVATKKIYTFLNLSLSSKINSYILNITYGGYSDGCNICTTRSNATRTANRWRIKLPFLVVQEIQRGCQNVLEIMGYVNFKMKKDLRDLHKKSTEQFL